MVDYSCFLLQTQDQLIYLYTVKRVYNGTQRIVAIVDNFHWYFKIGPQNGGRYRQVVAAWRWSLAQDTTLL